MRVLLAGRLSQLQPGQTGMESREQEMAKWAQANGHEVIGVTEDWRSGTTPLTERPDLRPWVTETALLAQYDALVAYEAARLSRGPKAMTNAIESWAVKHGKLIVTVRDGLRFPAEGTEGILWDVTHRVNHQRWLDDSRHYRNMQAHLVDSGYLVGKPPFGYRAVVADESGHKTLAPDPTEADAIRAAVARYLAGDSLRAVGAWLDSEGIGPRRGGTWDPKSLSQIFRNETLIGRRTARVAKEQRRTLLKCPPVLDKQTWAELQAQLDRKARRAGVAPAQTALLTSILRCGKCGGPMYRINAGNRLADGTRTTILYYRCHGNGKAPSQCKNWVRLDSAEAEFEAMIDAIGDTPHMEPRLIAATGNGDAIADVERDIRELDFDAPDYAERHAALLARRATLKAAPAQSARTEWAETGKAVDVHWASLDTAGRRAWLMERGFTATALDGKVEIDRAGDIRLRLTGQPR